MSWYKSQIKNYRFYRIKNIAIAFIVTLLLIYLSYPLIHGFIYLLSQDSVQHSIKTINEYNSFIIAILTFFLFLVTAFYAWVTLKMFREQSEKIRVELRPNIFIAVSDVKFTTDPLSNRRTALIYYMLSNFGKGTAIKPSIDFYIMYDIDSLTSKIEYITYSFRVDPFFQSGHIINKLETISTQMYELNKFTEEFLIISLSYEDVQRNIYNLKQYYNLVMFDINTKPLSTITLSKEMLFFTSFRYRNSSSSLQDEKKKLLWKTSRF